MKFLESILNEFVYGGHLFSVGASSIVFTAAVLLGAKITWDFLIIVYLGMHSAYLFNRFKEIKKDYLTNPERTSYLESRIKSLKLIILLYICSLFSFLIYFNGIKFLFFAFILFILSFVYSIYFKKFTKDIIGFKNFFVSLMWSFLVIMFYYYYSYPLNVAGFFIMFFVYLRLFIHESFCDIKDIESDNKEKLLTFPIVLGKEKLIEILHIVNIVAIIPVALGVYFRFFPLYSVVLFLTVPYTIYYLKKAEKLDYNQTFLYNVLGDGEFIFWSFFIFLGKIFYVGF